MCTTEQRRLCSPGCDPDIPRYQESCCDGAFLSQANTDVQLASYPFQSWAFFWSSALSVVAYVCVGLRLNMALHLFLLNWFFFSLLKHIAVYLFLICYAYKLLKLYVRSVVVPKLPGCVWPELPEGPSSMHSLSSAIPSIFFSSVCIYFSSFILTSGYKISTVLLLF